MDFQKLEDGRSYLSDIPGYDPSFELVYFAEWIGYEDYQWIAIVEKDGLLFLLEGGYSPADECADVWNPEAVNEMIAYHRIIDFNKDVGDI